MEKEIHLQSAKDLSILKAQTIATSLGCFARSRIRRHIREIQFLYAGTWDAIPRDWRTTETQEGKTFGKGGQPRIVWALLQVLNAVHLAVTGKALYTDDTVGDLANEHNSKVGTTKPGVRPPVSK